MPPAKSFKNFFRRLLKVEYFIEEGESDKRGLMLYKVQVLKHEVVKHLVGDHYRFICNPTEKVDHQKIQHVSFMVDSYWKAPSWLRDAKQLKTLLFLPYQSCGLIVIPELNEILETLKVLQALDLAIVNCKSCLTSVGKLKHLRYLRLGVSYELLPNHLTDFPFLQTLDLRRSGILQLPKDFCTLSNSLRHLYVGDKLTDLPPRFADFSKLETLDVFILGKNNGLDTLAHFTKLVGTLKIRYQQSRDHHKLPEHDKILAKMTLDNLSLVWKSLNADPDVITHQKEVVELEFLQPPPTVKNLEVQGWTGISFPNWAMEQKFSYLLSNLVSLKITDCSRCRNLPSFSTMYNLVSLQLRSLNALDLIEDSDNYKEAASTKTFYPSLKFLMLANLPQLKGWFKSDKNEFPEQVFNYLSELRINGCPKLMSMPLVRTVETLEAVNIHANLLKQLLNDQETSITSTLKKLHINSVHELDSLSVTLSSLHTLTMRKCKELIKVVLKSSTPLRRLGIHDCSRLRDLSPPLHRLSVLEELEIESCEELDSAALINDDEGISEISRTACKHLQSLHILKLTNIIRGELLVKALTCFTTLQKLSLHWQYKLRNLPESIGYLSQLQWLSIRYLPDLVSLPESLVQLSALQHMEIRYCPRLNQLPKSFNLLKSLQRLEIVECIKLKERCQKPNGEDWPLIKHISNFHLR
ncbi:putative disease resistance protein RGA4 [Amaranthus tricolor]|uniref:putative disease resistance protein RGA4 n=1 Tax=Amaranthus tricolor TaxID=29722 RepID=UPI00258C2F19|nr:putative disease resistance protein RGA4 [Amaranthus tricolor]XP_057541148.1 putative disease resistance protein RGA4 [Amaranthus tricolor]